MPDNLGSLFGRPERLNLSSFVQDQVKRRKPCLDSGEIYVRSSFSIHQYSIKKRSFGDKSQGYWYWMVKRKA